MKTIMIFVILCCNSQDQNGYKYDAKNINTEQTGVLYSNVKYNEGDTVIIKQ